jgi:toxin ParE1/3/4
VKLTRSALFEGDVEELTVYFLSTASEPVADRFLETVLLTLDQLLPFPNVGVAKEFSHAELQGLRLIPLTRPFGKYLLFYRVTEDAVYAERLLHGYRDLPRRLLDPPGGH